MKMKPVAATLVALASLIPAAAAIADERVDVDTFLSEGQLSEAETALQQQLKQNPDDPSARFSLGAVQFFQAIEQLGQDQYRYGLLGGRTRSIPFMRLPVPENREPEQINYTKARQIIQRLLDQLTKARETLDRIDGRGVDVPMKLGLVRIDLNGDGEYPDEETIWYVSQVLQNPRLRAANTVPQEFPVRFDDADVPWLQGYCHLLSALCEIILAHDWQDQFERTAHLFYPNVDTPYEFLTAEGPGQFMSFGAQNLFDFVALLHTINYEVKEPERMRHALEHLEQVISLSRESWKRINEEDDDDREWVPGPHQTSVMKGFNVGQDIVSGWHEFLDEFELILKGEKLAPFWRGIDGGISPFGGIRQINPKIGINVRKVFTDPRRFDLALWLQGTGLQPFLEEGDITSPEKWQKMMSRFNGRFWNFALWFN